MTPAMRHHFAGKWHLVALYAVLSVIEFAVRKAREAVEQRILQPTPAPAPEPTS